MKIQAARERNKNIRRLFTLFNISGEKKTRANREMQTSENN